MPQVPSPPLRPMPTIPPCEKVIGFLVDGSGHIDQTLPALPPRTRTCLMLSGSPDNNARLA